MIESLEMKGSPSSIASGDASDVLPLPGGPETTTNSDGSVSTGDMFARVSQRPQIRQRYGARSGTPTIKLKVVADARQVFAIDNVGDA